MAIQDYYYDIPQQRKTRAPDGIGGYITTNEALGTIKGTINQASSKEVQQAAQFNITATHKLFTDVDNDIHYDDILTDRDGETYRVVSQPKNTMQRNHHIKIYLEWTAIRHE